MKKKIAIILVLMVILIPLVLVGCNKETEVAEQSDMAKWLDEWLPRIETALITLGMIITTILVMFKNFKSQSRLVKGAITELDLKTKEFQNKEADLAKGIKELEKVEKDLKDATKELKAVQGELDTLKQMITIMVGSTDELVRKGVADKLVEMGGFYEKETKSER